MIFLELGFAQLQMFVAEAFQIITIVFLPIWYLVLDIL